MTTSTETTTTTTTGEATTKPVIRYTREEMEKLNKPELFSSDFKLKLLDGIQFVAQAQSEALSASYERYSSAADGGGGGGRGGPPTPVSPSSGGPPMGRGMRGRGRGIRGAFRGGWGRGSFEDSGDSSSSFRPRYRDREDDDAYDGVERVPPWARDRGDFAEHRGRGDRERERERGTDDRPGWRRREELLEASAGGPGERDERQQHTNLFKTTDWKRPPNLRGEPADGPQQKSSDRPPSPLPEWMDDAAPGERPLEDAVAKGREAMRKAEEFAAKVAAPAKDGEVKVDPPASVPVAATATATATAEKKEPPPDTEAQQQKSADGDLSPTRAKSPMGVVLVPEEHKSTRTTDLRAAAPAPITIPAHPAGPESIPVQVQTPPTLSPPPPQLALPRDPAEAWRFFAALGAMPMPQQQPQQQPPQQTKPGEQQPQQEAARPSPEAYFMSLLQQGPVPMPVPIPVSPGSPAFPFFMMQNPSMIPPPEAAAAAAAAAAMFRAGRQDAGGRDTSPQAHIIHAQLQAHLLAIAQHHAAQQQQQQQQAVATTAVAQQAPATPPAQPQQTQPPPVVAPAQPAPVPLAAKDEAEDADIAKLHEALLSPQQPPSVPAPAPVPPAAPVSVTPPAVPQAPPKAESPSGPDDVAELHMLLTGTTSAPAPAPVSEPQPAAAPVSPVAQPQQTEKSAKPRAHQPQQQQQQQRQQQPVKAKTQKGSSQRSQKQAVITPEAQPAKAPEEPRKEQSQSQPAASTVEPAPVSLVPSQEQQQKKFTGWAQVQGSAVKSLATIVAEEEVRRKQEDDAQAAREQAEHAAMMAALVADDHPQGWAEMDPAVVFVGEKRDFADIQREELAQKQAADLAREEERHEREAEEARMRAEQQVRRTAWSAPKAPTAPVAPTDPPLPQARPPNATKKQQKKAKKEKVATPAAPVAQDAGSALFWDIGGSPAVQSPQTTAAVPAPEPAPSPPAAKPVWSAAPQSKSPSLLAIQQEELARAATAPKPAPAAVPQAPVKLLAGAWAAPKIKPKSVAPPTRTEADFPALAAQPSSSKPQHQTAAAAAAPAQQQQQQPRLQIVQQHGKEQKRGRKARVDPSLLGFTITQRQDVVREDPDSY